MKRFDGQAGGALVVNLFGGPGSGKSTVGARLFSELKRRGVEAACPEEHAKLAIWSGRPWLLDHQVIMVGKVWETLTNLRDKVGVIIVDSPILLGSVYAGDREPRPFHDLVLDLHRRTPRVNLMVARPADEAYDPSNRREDAQEALALDGRIRGLLEAAGESPHEVSRDDDLSAVADRIRTLL